MNYSAYPANNTIIQEWAQADTTSSMCASWTSPHNALKPHRGGGGGGDGLQWDERTIPAFETLTLYCLAPNNFRTYVVPLSRTSSDKAETCLAPLRNDDQFVAVDMG